jgi:hypothetical protein
MCDTLRDSDLPKAGIVLEDLANSKTRWFPVDSTAAKLENEVSLNVHYAHMRLLVYYDASVLHLSLALQCACLTCTDI